TASNTTGSVSPIAGFAYAPSVGVTVTVSATGGTGWSATATHTGWGAGTKTCAIFIGVSPVTPATNEGEPKCQT
ncbi:MAG TPA: hypothetical protein VFY16_13575, partial [Gemmatimonadaceae bacterium]|nr:hypothetical protein [Gemmatimonadaceae bacterium]